MRAASIAVPFLPVPSVNRAEPRPRRLPRPGIRSRVFALALLGAAVPALLASAYFEARARDRLQAAEARAAAEAKLAAREINALVAQARMLVTTLASIPEVRRGEGTACAATLRRVLPTAGWLAALSVIRADGLVLCSTNASAPGLNVGDRPHIRRAIETRRFVLSDLLPSRARNALPSLYAIEPVLRDDGTVDVLMSAALDPDWVVQNLHARLGESWRVSLVDGQDLLVARHPPFPAAIGRSYQQSDLVVAARAHGEGHVSTAGLDGVQVVFGFAPIAASGAVIVAGQEAAAILGPIEAESRSSYLVLALSGGLVLLLGLFGGEILLISPIAALGRTIDRLAEGDIEARPQLGQFSAPELATLAGRVAQMAENQAARGRELTDARDAARAASTARGWFLSAAGHELRTPLNSVLGWTQALLIDPRLPASLRDHVEDIGRAGWRLNGIVSRLLEATRLEAEPPCLGPVDVAALGEACLAQLRPAAAEAGLALVLETAPGLPPRLMGDGRRLPQILHSLLENAVKFGRHGEVRLRLSWRAGPGRLRAEVLDHGPGVPAGLRNRLFEDFAHQDQTGGGLGLGLSVSARLAAQLGGEMGHADRPDGQRGSLFWLEVPAEPVS